jgi:hypothetical protein
MDKQTARARARSVLELLFALTDEHAVLWDKEDDRRAALAVADGHVEAGIRVTPAARPHDRAGDPGGRATLVSLKHPKHLYVRMEEDGGESYAVAHETLGEAVLDDGKTRVGTYQLLRVDRYRRDFKLVKEG